MDHVNKPQPVALIHHTRVSKLSHSPRHPNSYGLESLDDDSSNGGLVDYWRLLRRYRRAILLSSICGLIIGFSVGIPMKPVYRTTTSVEVLTLNENFMNMKQANPTTTNDGNYDTSEEQTQAKLLESSALLNHVIAKMGPDIRKMNSNTTPSGWRLLLHQTEPTAVPQRQILLLAAARSLKVRLTPRTRLLEIAIDSTDPKLAAEFANTLTQEFITENMEARWASTARTSEWLRRELDDARDKLRKSEDALQEYARISGLIFTDESTNVATEKLQQVQQNLSSASAERISKQSRFELAQSAPPDSLADILNDSSLRETQSKLNDLKRQIADLDAIYSPEYSKLRRLQAELESLQAAFDRQRSDIIARIRNDYTEASRKENLLKGEYKTQAQEVTGQDEKAIQYNILKRDVDSNRQLYDTMLQQMKQASIASALRASNVRVVDPAELPTVPISPNFKLNSGLGLVAGLVLCIVVVTIRERADRTLQQPGDIKMWAELPELGVIPNASLQARRYSYRSSDASSFATSNFRETIANRLSMPGNLVSWDKKPSVIAEAFRSTLTSILFIGENGSRPKVLVFTSADAGEGKTTAVSNIAIAAAEIKMRVLVVDADLRRPRMHQLFKLSNTEGLSDLLSGEWDEHRLSSLVNKTDISALHVLTAGPPTDSAAHLLYSPNLSRMLECLRPLYDLILIDTPPMLEMTDARVTGRMADAVVLVARSNSTTRDSLIAARERLAEDNTRIIGAILNDWNPRETSGGYYGYYRRKGYGSYKAS